MYSLCRRICWRCRWAADAYATGLSARGAMHHRPNGGGGHRIGGGAVELSGNRNAIEPERISLSIGIREQFVPHVRSR